MKIIGFAVGILFLSCQSPKNKGNTEGIPQDVSVDYQKLDTATFAGGCFWCVEASFEQIKGVVEAVSGYAGGKAVTATYQRVSSGETAHAEAVQVYYDPSVIDYLMLLDIFFTAHDPTQVDRQGPDIGTQYRSEIFYHNAEQKRLVEEKMKELASQFPQPIATRLSKLERFYEAEAYHQDYEKNHPNNGYIVNVSRPKIEKVARKFKHLLKN